MNTIDTVRFPNGQWLLCAPQHFDVSYEINPWMSVKNAPNRSLAARQWQELHHVLLRLGAWIEYVQGAQDVPDLVFTANAGLVRGSKVVLSKFAHAERSAEEQYFRDWFERYEFSVLEVTSGAFEGEGDALFAGDTLFAGFGFRSEEKAYDEVADYLGIKTVVGCELIDPRFYHLDTCFSPITEDKAIYVPGAFSAESIKRMEQHIDLYPVSDADAKRFVCNTVVLGKDLVQPAGCDETYAMLKKMGFQSHPVALDEFLKGGGSAKCLTLRLDRPL